MKLIKMSKPNKWTSFNWLAAGLICSVISSTTAAGQQQQQQQQQANQQQQQQQSSTTSVLKPSAGASPTSGSAMASLVAGLKTQQQQQPTSDGKTSTGSGAESPIVKMRLDEQLATFSGRNPFADDSLWQIPIQFEREHLMSAMAPNNVRGDLQTRSSVASKSASSPTTSISNLDNDNDSLDSDSDDAEDMAALLGDILGHGRPSPAVISASTTPTGSASSTAAATSPPVDLKTAAGFHYPAAAGYSGAPHHAHHGDYHSGAAHEPPHHSYHHHQADEAYAHPVASGHYGKYFQYASVPYPYAWDFGYRRGNPYHTIERHEHGKGPHFQTKVKWSDKYGGHGVHVWDYNHDDHSAKYDSYGHHAPEPYHAHHGHGHPTPDHAYHGHA